MFLITWTAGSRKEYLWEEQDDGTPVWSTVPEDAIIFDTLFDAVEVMLTLKDCRLENLNVVPYVEERIRE